MIIMMRCKQVQLWIQSREVPPGHDGGGRLDIEKAEHSSMRAEQFNPGEDSHAGAHTMPNYQATPYDL
jgi:hypothetical protein